MTVDDATLLAFADGMLPADEASAVARAVARDRQAAEKLRAMRESARLVRDAHAYAFTAPVPDELASLLRARRPARRAWPWRALSWHRWLPAVAASACALVIGVAAGRSLLEPQGVVSLAAAHESSALDDTTALLLIMALETDAIPAPAGGVASKVTILGEVDAGLGVPCRRFAIAEVTPVRGLACRGGDGAWSFMLLPGPPA